MEFRFVNEHDPVALRRRRLQASRRDDERKGKVWDRSILPVCSSASREYFGSLACFFLTPIQHRVDELYEYRNLHLILG
ncbi:hypothetical protein RAB80_009050 [Fusarium oxysporum f. sp. vasinfectum]|nr:hypothetical protein RAB80_009050 [Fusarium oxysporum f. sp. vasinfectum]KAK2930502.1 hypothetical protein FoTM2_008012 [Fusarium oxysporum f. sp. vasinfectum]